MEQYKDIVIRPYQTGDAEKIYSLFSRYTPYVRDDQFWVWINRIICNQSIIAVASHGDVVVAHYAVVPRKICIAGQNYNAALTIHAFVDPNYRKAVRIYSVTQLVHQMAQEQGISFIYSFPNINYRLIKQRIEGFEEVALFDAMEMKVANILCPDTLSLRMEEIKEVNFKDLFIINEFLETSNFSKVCLVSDVRYWMERYFLHPQKLYRIYRLLNSSGVIGYIVIKQFVKQGFSYLHIIDYILSDEKYSRDLLQIFLNYSKGKADIVSVWKGSDTFQQELFRSGFRETGFDTWLGVKFLNEQLDTNIQNMILNFNNWRLVMGDSDAF